MKLISVLLPSFLLSKACPSFPKGKQADAENCKNKYTRGTRSFDKTCKPLIKVYNDALAVYQESLADANKSRNGSPVCPDLSPPPIAPLPPVPVPAHLQFSTDGPDIGCPIFPSQEQQAWSKCKVQYPPTLNPDIYYQKCYSLFFTFDALVNEFEDILENTDKTCRGGHYNSFRVFW